MLGVFDSGLGGLTVLKEIKKKIKNEQIIYFGDTARVPWGDKSPETVRQYAEEITAFLLSRGAKKIVIACNTASALAKNHLIKKYPQIIFYNVITPAVGKAKKDFLIFKKEQPLKKYRLGIIGTNGTINSGAYQKEIKRICPVVILFPVACPLLVPIVEENLAKSEIAFLTVKNYLAPLKNKKINALILGCTHYPLLAPVIKKVLGKNVRLIDGSETLAKELRQEIIGTGSAITKAEPIKNKSAKARGADEFWFSDWNDRAQKMTQMILGEKIKVKIKALGK